jgi:hypothetical protein
LWPVTIQFVLVQPRSHRSASADRMAAGSLINTSARACNCQSAAAVLPAGRSCRRARTSCATGPGEGSMRVASWGWRYQWAPSRRHALARMRNRWQAVTPSTPVCSRRAAPEQGGWSILLVNLHQRVQPAVGAWRGFRGGRLRRASRCLPPRRARRGWTLHPYLSPTLWRTVARAPVRPDSACSHRAPMMRCSAPSRAFRGNHRPARPRRQDRRAIRSTASWSCVVKPDQPSADPDRAIAFRIQWADLWLFPDADDLVSTTHNALLAIKVEPLRVHLGARGRVGAAGRRSRRMGRAKRNPSRCISTPAKPVRSSPRTAATSNPTEALRPWQSHQAPSG